jgi:transposase
MDRPDLERLSRDELIELVLRLQRPEKASRTSSKPPSTDRKARRDASRPGGAKPGHEGHSRTLGETFDRVVDHRPDECPGCRAALPADLPSETISEHDTIELPPIRPFVERHRRRAVRCPSCGMRVAAAVPDAAKGTPFGARIHAIATYLKTFQALSYGRLQGALADLFGLTISQGGLMNMLRRAQEHFVGGRDAAVSKLRQASVVSSDETGVRIEGSNSYHGVFRCDRAVVHTAAPTRGAIVVRTMMDGHRPDVWCSDRYVAQQGHADAQQACLAHLARDVAYAIENGDDFLPMRLKLWLQKAFGLAKDIGHLAPSRIAARRRALDRDVTPDIHPAGTRDRGLLLRVCAGGARGCGA